MAVALLDTFGDSSSRELRRFSAPRQLLVARDLAAVPDVLRQAERAAERGMHAVGFVTYEAAPAFDGALAAHPPGSLPLAWFGVFDPPAVVRVPELPDHETHPWTRGVSRAEHGRRVETIRRAIGRGEVYQVNYTMPLGAPAPADPLGLFARLRAAQPTPYAAFIDIGTHCIVSASPELFVRREGRVLTTRPMKGTAPRGRWRAEDERRRDTLRGSAKERAENIMIVDLLRNDLGRVAERGSVSVPDLLAVERYPTVWQLTSTVQATARPGVGLAETMAALFPCGSVTGAPKIAATRMIAELEGEPRGIYCGAIGHIAPGGDFAFSVAIRTVCIDRASGIATYGVGGGITWDSDPQAEYDEAVAKGAVLTVEHPTFSLLETMRLEQGAYARLDRHLARLEESAAWFGRPLDGAAVRDLLAAHASAHAFGAYRVRLTVDASGAPTIEAMPLPPDPVVHQRVVVARDPIRRGDPFLQHKTTHRAVYDRHRRAHPDAFDVLLYNEAGEATEFTIGNLVAMLDGERVTPPRECGLLPGTFRAELLATGAVRERVIHVHDLARASALWLVNSVRGWVPVALDG